MINKLRCKLKLLIEENLKGYILLVVVFLAGAAGAVVFRGKSIPEEEIRLYISDFFKNTASAGTDSLKTFYLSVFSYFKTALLLLFLSVSVIGAPMTLVLSLLSGFSYGTVLYALFHVFGVKALFVFFGAIFPHSLISAPCTIVYAFCCMKNSGRFFCGGEDFKKSFITPVLMAIIFLSVTSVAALVQAYVEPLLISLFASRFV